VISPIASDLSYPVLRLRQLRGELVTPPLDELNRRARSLPVGCASRVLIPRPNDLAEPNFETSDRARHA
jgi:hypothetical protein